MVQYPGKSGLTWTRQADLSPHMASRLLCRSQHPHRPAGKYAQGVSVWGLCLPLAVSQHFSCKLRSCPSPHVPGRHSRHLLFPLTPSDFANRYAQPTTAHFVPSGPQRRRRALVRNFGRRRRRRRRREVGVDFVDEEMLVGEGRNRCSVRDDDDLWRGDSFVTEAGRGSSNGRIVNNNGAESRKCD